MRVGSEFRLFLLGLAGGLLAVPAATGADVYRFIDDSGAIHFSDSPVDARFAPVALTPVGLRAVDRARKLRRRPPHVTHYDGLISRLSRDHRVEAALLKAVIAAESNFDPRAVSIKGAQGLMQLMPETARALGVDDVFEPEQNVRGGARYLREMLNRYGDVSRALAAYNAGPEAVDRYRGIPPYRETQDYVDRVLTYYLAYNEAFSH